MQDKLILALATCLFVGATAGEHDASKDFFSEKLDWDKVKMTKLRMLLLGELFKNQIQNEVPSVDLSCDSSSSQLLVNTKNCPCKSFSCRDIAPATNHNRIFHTSCKEYCCSLKFKRSAAPYQHRALDNHVLKKKPTCGRGRNPPVVEILDKWTNETICSGVTLSRRVILTTASCVYDTSLQDLAIKMSYSDAVTDRRVSAYARLIRKMQHGKYKPTLGQFGHDVALLVAERELKMWDLLTSNENDFYMCLPKAGTSNSWKIENSSTNCYVPVVAEAAGAGQMEEVVAAVGTRHRQKPNHDSGTAASKVFMSVYKASECDKITGQQRQYQGQPAYLHNGSICGVVKDHSATEDAARSAEAMQLPGNQQLLGGLPLICSSGSAVAPGQDSFGTARRTAAPAPAANYFVQGLLAKFPSAGAAEAEAVENNGTPVASNHEIRSRKSAFIFVNMAQYVDWINLQMEKLNSYMYA